MKPDYTMDESIFENNAKIFLNKAVVNGTIDCHSHDFIEIAYIDAGSGVHETGDRQTECGAGDYFIINYNVPHRFCCRDQLVVYNCIFAPEFIDYSMLGCKDFDKITGDYLLGAFLPYSGFRLSELKFQGSGETGRIFDTMYREYCGRQTGYTELIRGLLIELIIYTLRQAKKSCLSHRAKAAN